MALGNLLLHMCNASESWSTDVFMLCFFLTRKTSKFKIFVLLNLFTLIIGLMIPNENDLKTGEISYSFKSAAKKYKMQFCKQNITYLIAKWSVGFSVFFTKYVFQ